MKLGFLLFMLIPAIGNVYVLWHVFRIVPFSPWGKWALMVVMVALFFGLFFSMGRSLDRMPMGLATVTYELTTSWVIMLLYLFLLFLVADILRLCHVLPPELLRDSWKGTLGIVAIVTALLVYGNIHYKDKQRQTLELTTSKELLRPMKIIMLSDLHLGYHNRREELHRWVEMMNKEKADLILVAGDIIDRSVRPLIDDGMDEELLRLNAPVVACLGNHEYYAGEPNLLDFFKRADIRLLRDSVMDFGPLQIIGRDDRTNFRRKPVAELCKNVDPGKYTILLDHQPYDLEKTELQGIDFQLSGHTHHGQVWPISWITEAIYECAYGSHQRGLTQFYVSSGLGIWGGKFRIGTCSEYVVAELKEAPQG
ncbi:MAG: metallophosphoesterase [Prevotella sp.]|nr:metallophosphoesterase [Prevotella sp.]